MRGVAVNIIQSAGNREIDDVLTGFSKFLDCHFRESLELLVNYGHWPISHSTKLILSHRLRSLDEFSQEIEVKVKLQFLQIDQKHMNNMILNYYCYNDHQSNIITIIIWTVWFNDDRVTDGHPKWPLGKYQVIDKKSSTSEITVTPSLHFIYFTFFPLVKVFVNTFNIVRALHCIAKFIQVAKSLHES